MTPAPVDEIPVGGHAGDGFEKLAAAFRSNFTDHGELGASVCAYVHGEQVVSLWGGWKDGARTEPWAENTIVCMMSVGKGVAALCLHHLVDRGLVDLDERVAHYWPGFAEAGKDEITVRRLISHHAGILYADHAPLESALDWPVMIDALEKQPSEWPAGTRGAYHSSTYGHLVGELVRLVSGQTIGNYFREQFAEPMALDYHIGVPKSALSRIADLRPHSHSDTLRKTQTGTGSLARAYRHFPKSDPYQDWIYNSTEMRLTEYPSGNGHGNAAAIATLFAMLAQGGIWQGKRYFSERAVTRMNALQWAEPCGLTGRRYRMGMGFFLNSPPYIDWGPNPYAFGTFGLGGSTGFVDPARGLAFGYAMNQINAGSGLGDRCERLIGALYDCL